MMGESLIDMCRDADMPGECTVYGWLLKHSEFVKKYMCAREIQAERGIDEIISIADDGRNDWMEIQNDDGENVGWRQNPEAMRRSQIRIDARKWKASKLRPKVYGDNLRHEPQKDDAAERIAEAVTTYAPDESGPDDPVL
jgi:hypothetical protein